MKLHRTTVLIPSIPERHGKEISQQVRHVLRMAAALYNAGIPYELDWGMKQGWFGKGFGATLTVCDAVMPAAKPFPKEPRLKIVGGWAPKIWDAEYQLEAWHSTIEKKNKPGFVIAHSCGLSLVKPSETGELSDDGSSDIREGWRLTHTASGLGFGIDLKFGPAVKALLLVAGEFDWTQSAESIKGNVQAKRAQTMLRASYGKGSDRKFAQNELRRAA